MSHNPTPDAAPIHIAQNCIKKAYSAPCLRDLDDVDTTEGGTQPNPVESMSGISS